MKYLNSTDFQSPDIKFEEVKRRLARYDDAIRLLQLAAAELYRPMNQRTFNGIDAFLAAEPKEGR